MDQVIEQQIRLAVEEMRGLCPWMTEEDIRRFLRMLYASVEGESVGVLLEESYVLRQRSVQVGDRRREWAFYHQYQWACAAECGQEYQWPAMPADIEVLP